MDPHVIDRLAEAKVLVVGDVLLDRFVEGHVTRISREAPVPVFKPAASRARLGGASNVAANILAYGGAVTLVGLTGDDDAAAELAGLCTGFHRLTSHLVAEPGRQTTVKTRYLSNWRQLFCVDAEDTRPAAAETRSRIAAAATAAFPDMDVLVISDYARGALDDETIAILISGARKAGKPVVVDPRRGDAAAFAGASLITPNVEEMARFAGIQVDSNDSAEAACAAVLAKAAVDAILLTRGAGGMTLAERGQQALHVDAETRRVFDVTGAGDTVVATVAAALAIGSPLADAVRLANTAAGIAVTKPGTAVVLPLELRQALGELRSEGTHSHAEAAEHIALWKELGLTVGFTNGCFDLLHRGHLHSLEQAARRVDRLVVGVNADASARRLKGPDRPVQDAITRAAVLGSLRFVDLVVIFEEDTPEDLIRTLKPDMLFKGADYAGREVPGAAFVMESGGKVELLPLLEGYSTSGTVERVRAVNEPQP
jgi:D-beta-D-heptose 7-phosphate kinase/D-beta-D-heptose 1-phosphate adenosyltransferase